MRFLGKRILLMKLFGKDLLRIVIIKRLETFMILSTFIRKRGSIPSTFNMIHIQRIMLKNILDILILRRGAILIVIYLQRGFKVAGIHMNGKASKVFGDVRLKP